MGSDKAVVFVQQLPATFPGAKRSVCSNSGNNLAKVIAEMNKEMEDAFGEPPAVDFSGSHANNTTTEPQVESLKCEGSAHGLTHVGSSGEAQMVDISPKDISMRTAAASCKVMLAKEVFDMVHSNQIAKGEVLTVAKIAGISGAKQTSNLIPLCHNILLTHVDVELKLNYHDCSVEIKGVASCSGKNGVEMKAIKAASIAGGKSGDWF